MLGEFKTDDAPIFTILGIAGLVSAYTMLGIFVLLIDRRKPLAVGTQCGISHTYIVISMESSR